MSWIRKLKSGLFGAGIAAMCLVVWACETTDVSPISASERPNEATDEAGLWLQMDKAEKELRSSSLVIRDEALNAYVRGVVCKVVGPAYCDDIRVYVVKQPFFNANMAPNGQMQIWTGLLLRAQNEAQLAFVIGHEFAHYQQRHSLQQWREIKNAANTSLLFGVGVAAAGVPEAAVLGDFSLAARLYGFGRDKERESDQLGFEFATSAGYAGGEAAALWQYLVGEVSSSDVKRKRKQVARASIFSTHPVTTERIEYLTRLAEKEGREGVLNEDEYLQAMDRFRGEWLDDELVRRDFGESLFLIDKLLSQGRQPGLLHYYRGEVFRLRRNEGDADRSLSEYLKASTFDDVPAVVWRQIGDAERGAGNKDQAITAYQTYLREKPDASDRALVESYLD